MKTATVLAGLMACAAMTAVGPAMAQPAAAGWAMAGPTAVIAAQAIRPARTVAVFMLKSPPPP